MNPQNYATAIFSGFRHSAFKAKVLRKLISFSKILSNFYYLCGTMRPFYLLFAFVILLGTQSVFSSNTIEESLKKLDHTIRSAPEYTRLKNNEIDSIRRVLKKIPASNLQKRLDITFEISEKYRTFNTDSAVFYAQQASSMLRHRPFSDPAIQEEYKFMANIAWMKALSTAGLFTPALSVFENLKAEPLSAEQKVELWKSGRQMYSYMQAYVAHDSQYFTEYEQLYIAYDDSLLNHLPKTDKFFRFIQAERQVRDGKLKEAESGLRALIKTLPPHSNLYGMATFQLAEVYKRLNKTDLFVYFLTRAAISDIQQCTREGLALPTLAQWLYSKGMTNEAFRYINFALSEANIGNARMRSVAIASSMPLIDSAYREKISSKNRKLTILVILITIFSIITVFLTIFLFKSIRHTRSINKKLRAANTIQENYIGHYIALSASYARRLDSLTHLVKRKISSGQTEDLLRLLKSGKYADSRDDEFYSHFDKAFLDIFPDFIEEINSLMHPDKRFSTDSPGLSPELRIYALVRLGITESTRISYVLHYSVATIYTYRNRMRNRAIDRDRFEEDILKIGRH